MNTSEINNYLKDLPGFIGAYALDKIPIIRTYPSSIIVNTQKHTEPGEHWVAIYYVSPQLCYYFDSFGFGPLQSEIQKRLSSKCYYNTRQIQPFSSYTCGLYCIYFLYYIRVFSFDSFVSLFYPNNYLFNDKLLHKLTLL